MSKVTEDMLMAYADGELDAETAARVARAVAADPVLRERLSDFERTRSLAKDAFGGVLEEPVPPALLDAAGRPAGAPTRSRWAVRGLLPGFALAAAAAAGFFIAVPIFDRVTEGSGPVAIVPEIASVLETASTGEMRSLPNGLGVLPTATYLAPEGVCRTFQARRDPSGQTVWHEVACRHNGVWEIELAVADHSGAADDGSFAPASDRTVQSIDSFLDAIGAGETLDETAERELRDHGWQLDGQAPHG